MSGKTRVDASERRRVLKTLVAAGGVTALAGVAGRAAASPPVTVVPQPEESGYRESDHIRTYYAKARY